MWSQCAVVAVWRIRVDVTYLSRSKCCATVPEPLQISFVPCNFFINTTVDMSVQTEEQHSTCGLTRPKLVPANTPRCMHVS